MPSREALVTVTNNGTGMTSGSIPELFQPVMQTPGAASNVAGGLGLGLVIVMENSSKSGQTFRRKVMQTVVVIKP